MNYTEKAQLLLDINDPSDLMYKGFFDSEWRRVLASQKTFFKIMFTDSIILKEDK